MRNLKWQVLQSEYILENNFFKVRKDICLNQNNIALPPYYVSEYANWVAAIVKTTDNKYILERSYRHALGQIHLEIPAGCVDLSDTNFETAIQRELLEETGYFFDTFEYLGNTSANPATNNNLMHFFYAENGVYKQEPILENGESFELIFVSLQELIQHLFNNQFIQSLHITALYTFLLKKGYLKIDENKIF